MLVHELPLGVYHSVSCLVKWWKLHSNSGRWGLFQIMFLFNAYCFFLKLYLRVRTCICNFHFPHGDKCIRGIVHIFVIFSAKYEIFHNLQLLQRTLLSNFTKYKNIQNTKKNTKCSTICCFYKRHFQAILQNTKKVQIFHNLKLLQRTLPSKFTLWTFSLQQSPWVVFFVDEFGIFRIFHSGNLLWSCFL